MLVVALKVSRIGIFYDCDTLAFRIIRAKCAKNILYDHHNCAHSELTCIYKNDSTV
jgi:hypothetical protein